MNGHEILLSPGFVENQHWSLGCFFADSQKFILSCVMQATWNVFKCKHCILCAISGKRGQSFKICFNDMMSWYQTWSLHYRQRFAWYLWSLSWCLMQLLATSTVVQFLTNQLKLSKLITTVIMYFDFRHLTRHTNFSFEFSLTV